MSDISIDALGQAMGDLSNHEKLGFDLGAFVGDLAFEEDSGSEDISLEGLQQELEECESDEVVANILSSGAKLREYAKGVENNLRKVELDSIEDYIKESDRLVSLHDQIHDCDSILSQMETLLSGFQEEIGSISSDIKILQEKSMDMGLRLKNRRVAESKLAKFVEDIIVPPKMIDVIVDGEVNEEYMRTLEILGKKLKFVEADPAVKSSKALKDVEPELEKLRQKAISKVYDFIVQKLIALRKPKTNIQILQQSVLLKYKYIISFLKEHGKQVFMDVRAAYIDTMNKVLSAHFRAYIQALEKLQLDIATAYDLIGVETRSSTGLFSRAREPLKNRSAVFALGERIKIIKEIDQPALIPHIAEASSLKYPYEVLFRSLHKLLMDTATSEYIFCDDFFGEESIFYEIFAGPFSVIDEHFNLVLSNCFDAIGLMLMIRIVHHHQLIMSRRRIPCLDSYLDKVNMSLWPRFKMVFDSHLSSLRDANIKTLWEDDVHPHYVMRRYAEFTASFIHLNVEYGDGQLDINLERLRMAVDGLILKLASLFPKPKQQIVFLINNYDMTIAVLKEAGPDGGKIQMHFEELLKSNTSLFVEELLVEHFSDLIKFVKSRASEDSSSNPERSITVAEVDSTEDYIKESDNLVSLHDQIHDCDSILSQMETLLSGFQEEIGSISSDIKILQEKSMDMGLRLKNRRVAESKLAKFVEDIIVPPKMIDVIVDGEVNEEYMRTLEILGKKLKFVEADPAVKSSKALKDVEPELEKLRQKAISKVYDFIVQKLIALRKPKTNIQILQQSVLLKYKYIISFLKEHGKQVFMDVRAAYIDTMNKVLSAHFRAYIQALEKLQLDIATAYDLIGVETRSSTGLFSRAREPLKNRSAVFALGERIKIIKEIDQPALIPHIAEASSLKYPYEVLFRSLHKLLMDTATSEYIFCDDFFGEESIFYEIFAGPFSVIDEHFNLVLSNCFDAIGLMLMIRIVHHHQLIMSRRRIPCLDSYLDKVNMSLWPRFKMVFDSHLSSLRDANIKTLWEDDVHPHYVMRRYAEFTASFIHLNVEYGDGQLDINLERLRMAVDGLILKLASLFPKPKQQIVFLINNYDMTIAVLKEAGPDGGKIQMHFEELLKSNTSLFVEELLVEHFSDLIKFVKSRASEDSSSNPERSITVAEVDSTEDYIKESDNLVSLHDQIHDCDSILSQMETLLSGFQEEIGSISSDIKILQEKSMDMGLRLKNRRVAESKLAKFVEDIIVPPKMIDVIVDGEVNEEYMRTLEILGKKLKFVEADPAVKSSKALKDVEPELEKLRQKAISKVYDFIVQKLIALRKPKTNIQILQQSVLLKYKYIISFLKEHGKQVFMDVRAAYIDTMNKVLSAHFRAYIQALEKLQLDIATAYDLIGVETRSSTGLFSRAREPLKNRSAVFALGERIKIIKEIDQPALIPHIAEASSLKYPYEVLFRSLHKLLMDTATSEYIFCDDFFGEESIFYEIFAGPFSVIDEHFNLVLSNCFDAIGLMLMIRIVHHHQLIMSRRRIPCLDSYLDKVNMSLWPRFKMVFDSHLSSLRDANIKTLWEDDVHPHYVMRRYAEFTASFIHLNVEYGDGQLDINLERLRMAVDGLILKLASLFPKPKQQIVFLINNYDMTIAVLKEAGPDGGKIQMHFEELLKSNTSLFVEELLVEHFSDLIKFVKSRASEDSSSNPERSITVAEVDPLVKDFGSRWKTAIELMHKDIITSFSNFLCGMEILRAALTQLLLYYTRLTDCIKKIPGGSGLNKDLVSIQSIMFEIRKYSKTF